MTILNAQKEFSLSIFEQAMLIAEQDNKKETLKWRVAPDQAFVLAKYFYGESPDPQTKRLFCDTFLDIPIEIEWDFSPNTVQLRDKSIAIVQIENLPNATI